MELTKRFEPDSKDIGGKGVDAAAHGGEAEIGAVHDLAGEQRPVRV